MTLTQAAFKVFTTEEIIKVTLDLQDNFHQDLKCIKKDLSVLRENFSKVVAEHAVTKQVNNVLRNQMVHSNWNLWVKNKTADVNVQN